MVALTPRDERRLGGAPDGDEIILAACEDVLAVWRPTDADESAIVRIVEVQKPSKYVSNAVPPS